MVTCSICLKASICFKPSMAEATEIGGVIMPSAIKAAPPIMAGITSHLFCRLTNVYKEKIPPSPLLSALNVSTTYLRVVCKVSVQIIQDNPPIMSSSLISLLLMMALKTYNGEVPISP